MRRPFWLGAAIRHRVLHLRRVERNISFAVVDPGPPSVHEARARSRPSNPRFSAARKGGT